MANQLSPTNTATAVSQALKDISNLPTRNPLSSLLLAQQDPNNSSTSATQWPRPVQIPIRSYGQPYNTGTRNQLRNLTATKQRKANASELQSALANRDKATTDGSIKEQPSWSALNLPRTNENNLQRQNQHEHICQQQRKKEVGTRCVARKDIQPTTSAPSFTAYTTSPNTQTRNAKPYAPSQQILSAEQTIPKTEPPVLPFLRQKQAQPRYQSLPQPIHQRSSAEIPSTSTPPRQPQAQYHQTTKVDRESSDENNSIAEVSFCPAFETNSKSDNAPRKETADKFGSPTHKSLRCFHGGNLNREFSDERSGDDSSYQSTGIPEHKGKLPRQEDEFDFAILLRPSKYEEHVDLPNDHAATLRSAKNIDSNSDRAIIVERIRRTGLHVKRLLSMDGKQSLLKVRAPQRVLELGAERLRLRKLQRFDQVWMVFTCELSPSFADFDPLRKRINFLDSEKQSIVHALLTASETDGGAGLNESCPVAARHVIEMYPLHKQDLALLKTRWVTFWSASLLSSNHQHDQAPGYGNKCAVIQNILRQPLDDVAQYFGERVAFYFAWMEMYTRWLVVPSVAGVILFSLQVHSHLLDHPAAPFYALFMALWTSAFIIAWRRRAAALAYRWGTLGYEDEEVTRPEFYGDKKRADKPHDDIEVDYQKRAEKHYARWKRLLKYSVTFPCVAGSIIAVVALAYFAFSTRDRLEAESLETKHEAALIAEKVKRLGTITLEDLQALAQLGVRWDFWLYLLLTPILYGLLIPVLDAAFTRAARLLNNWENHRTESRYQSHLILKVFSFRFVHVFASLYYYAFAPQGQTPSLINNTDVKTGMVRVAIQLASFMVTGQLWKNVMETLYPFIRRRLAARAKKRASNNQISQSTVFSGINAATAGPRGLTRPRGNFATSAKLEPDAMMSSNAVIHEQCVRLEQASDRAWEEAGLKQYDTFEDYTEMLVQFGYVSFFSLAFPLAPFFALLNNLLELRTDAFKLCHTRQRPLARKASGIGVWLHVLQVMSVIAVLTNCFHLAYSTSLLERVFPAVSSAQKVWIVFGIEHLLLMIKVWLACVVPSVPREVCESLRRERERAKHDSARAVAARMLAEVAANESSCGIRKLK